MFYWNVKSVLNSFSYSEIITLLYRRRFDWRYNVYCNLVGCISIIVDLVAIGPRPVYFSDLFYESLPVYTHVNDLWHGECEPELSHICPRFFSSLEPFYVVGHDHGYRHSFHRWMNSSIRALMFGLVLAMSHLFRLLLFLLIFFWLFGRQLLHWVCQNSGLSPFPRFCVGYLPIVLSQSAVVQYNHGEVGR